MVVIEIVEEPIVVEVPDSGTVVVEVLVPGDQGPPGDTGPQGPQGDIGPTGPTGPAGSDANVNNANVNTALQADPAASRSALGLGTAATQAATAFDAAGAADAAQAAAASDATNKANAAVASLPGFSTGTNTPVSAADSMVAAFGKLQAQISALLAETSRYYFGQSLAIIGDSRVQRGLKYYLEGTSADWKGLSTPGGFCGPGVTAAGTGTLEYRAADGYLRWTAPGDTAGPWTASYAGIIRLQSATTDKYFDIGMKSVTGMPGTDQTISVAVAGDLRRGWNAYGFWPRMLQKMGWLNNAPKMLGIGGNTTAHVVEQLPWLATQATGPGWDVILISTNDISAGTATATITANLQTIYDARRAQGRRLILVNEHARWGTALGTPMTSGQQTSHAAINAFIANYAAANGCILVDSYSATYDSGNTDRRPITGYLVDQVHPYDLGAQVIGEAIASAAQSLIGFAAKRNAGSPGNLLTIGYFSGSSGFKGAGVTGAVATSWRVGINGGDSNPVCSVEARSDGVVGNWQRAQFASTVAGSFDIYINSPPTLSSLGLAVGDSIYFEIEVNAASLVGVTNLNLFVVLTGSALATVNCNLASSANAAQQSGTFTLRSPAITIPPGTTSLSYQFRITHLAVSSGDIRVASAAIIKV